MYRTTADIMSGKGRSFLCVTTYYIENYNCERESVVSACRTFRSTHSYDRVAQLLHQIHADFEIAGNKIMVTIIDNETNFSKALKHIHINVYTVSHLNQFSEIPSKLLNGGQILCGSIVKNSNDLNSFQM